VTNKEPVGGRGCLKEVVMETIIRDEEGASFYETSAEAEWTSEGKSVDSDTIGISSTARLNLVAIVLLDG